MKRAWLLIIAVNLAALWLSGQSVRVVTLETGDVELLATRYAALLKAQEEWFAADEYVRKKYSAQSGAQYSEGFRHIVTTPKPIFSSDDEKMIRWEAHPQN